VLHETNIPAEHRSTAAVALWLFKCVTELYRVEQKKRMFFKWLVLGKGGVDDVGRESADSSEFLLETVIP